ncbi:hypothetical protein F5984_03220 [Rudanella paleaurantiibacter]|uniref:DUF600 family protein n=1 Tax=Rudanella paleaurantiibacter TaxID=2614655 RepID=A0A7J5U552_9BACT|nr:hypothetical protein [Rudanella paleaurantiibacter]KAB7732968.1 hypothetical protein F5984_03220 [Rudanella paleaurantiibacter]
MEKVIETTFKQVLSNLHKVDNWETCVLVMEYYNREPGVGYKAYCTNKSGQNVDIDADVNYDFLFLYKIIEWNRENATSSNLWNKAQFSLNIKGSFEIKTWWDEEFQKKLYNED